MALYCYGCGYDITHRATDRCSMLSDAFSKALPIWKRLVAERFDELKIDVDVNELLSHDDDGYVGRMCRSCVSALYRLEKLESSTRKNVDDAVDCIISTDQWSYLQSRKRCMPDDESPQSTPATRRRKIMPSVPPPSNTSDTPDVAVSYQ